MFVYIYELRDREEPLLIVTDFGERELKVGNEISVLLRPVHTELSLSLSGDQVLVEGQVGADIELTCCRCLKSFEHKIQKGFELVYRPDPMVDEEGEEFRLAYTDLEIGFYRNQQLDVSALISEQIVLEIPMKPVCQKGCKGLCDQCGADLNEGSCDCKSQTVDPRLAALSELKKRMSNEG
ncbi:DUF177 domain-containing protein [Acidobacteria bacterium AH-259-D05]|nr:DUF177 domain-containing protein [Acidobacteria bacterium AH-259-D05]